MVRSYQVHLLIPRGLRILKTINHWYEFTPRCGWRFVPGCESGKMVASKILSSIVHARH